MRRLITLALCFWGLCFWGHTVVAQEKSPQKSVTLELLQSRLMSVSPSHPRLMANAARFQQLRESIDQTNSIRDELAQKQGSLSAI